MHPDHCIHYNGLFHNDACAIGIRYDSVRAVPGAAYKTYPCIHRDVDTCEKREYPTTEQVKEHEAMIMAESNRLLTAMAAVTAAVGFDTHPTSGSIPCPVCGDGKLEYAVHRRGQVGRCNTPGCVSWHGCSR